MSLLIKATDSGQKQENELEVLQEQAATLKPDEAEKYVQGTFINLDRINYDLEKAKLLTKEATNVENSLLDRFNPFAKSEADKRSRLNTKAIELQNQAIAEMNTIIQKSIELTKNSYDNAQKMIQAIAGMLANGFRDRDGNIKKLTGVAKEQAEFMLVEAQKFVQHQLEYESQQAKHEQAIAKQDEKIQDIHTRLESKDSIDKEQSRNIQSLQNALQEKREKITHLQKQLDIKQGIDEGQEAKISELQNRVRDLEKSSGKMSLTLSIAALLVGIGSIVLQFLR